MTTTSGGSASSTRGRAGDRLRQLGADGALRHPRGGHGGASATRRSAPSSGTRTHAGTTTDLSVAPARRRRRGRTRSGAAPPSSGAWSALLGRLAGARRGALLGGGLARCGLPRAGGGTLLGRCLAGRRLLGGALGARSSWQCSCALSSWRSIFFAVAFLAVLRLASRAFFAAVLRGGLPARLRALLGRCLLGRRLLGGALGCGLLRGRPSWRSSSRWSSWRLASSWPATSWPPSSSCERLSSCVTSCLRRKSPSPWCLLLLPAHAPPASVVEPVGRRLMKRLHDRATVTSISHKQFFVQHVARPASMCARTSRGPCSCRRVRLRATRAICDAEAETRCVRNEFSVVASSHRTAVRQVRGGGPLTRSSMRAMRSRIDGRDTFSPAATLTRCDTVSMSTSPTPTSSMSSGSSLATTRRCVDADGTTRRSCASPAEVVVSVVDREHGRADAPCVGDALEQ